MPDAHFAYLFPDDVDELLGPHGAVVAISLAWRRDQTSPGRAPRLVLLAAREVSVELFPGWVRTGARTPSAHGLAQLREKLLRAAQARR